MPQPKKTGGKSPRKRQSPGPKAEAEASAEAERSADSETGSEKGSSGAEPFVGEPGPVHDPEAKGPTPEAEAELHALPGPEPEWDERALRDLLRTQGEVMHYAIGVAEQDWKHTEADLASISGPLSRILNRYPATRAAAGSADGLALTVAVGAYGMRSAKERRDALAEFAEEEEEVPITGAPAPPGSGPPAGHPAAVGPTPPARPPQPDDTPPEQIDWQKPA